MFLILKFSSASPLSFFAHGKVLGHNSFKKGLVVPQRLRDTFSGLAISDVLNYSKTGSLAKNHFWLVATHEKRNVLIIQMLFSCSIADLISDFQRQLNSFAFVNIGFDLLISVLNSKFSSAGSISVLIRRNGNCSFSKTEFEREYQP